MLLKLQYSQKIANLSQSFRKKSVTLQTEYYLIGYNPSTICETWTKTI